MKRNLEEPPKLPEKKKKNKVILSCVFIGLLTIAIPIFLSENFSEKTRRVENNDIIYPPPTNPETIETQEFFDPRLFDLGKNNFKDKNPTTKHFQSVVIPHHLLASKLISEVLENFSNREIKTVILVGPNHFEKGDALIYSTEAVWNTPFGLVEPDLDIMEDLKKSQNIKLNKNILEKEHSIAGLMPYIKYYFNKAKIVPLILSSNVTPEQTKKLATRIAEYTDQNTILIGSIDFSHYLDPKQAMINDQKTIQAIKKFDYQTISGFNNDFVDSPACLNLILMTCRIDDKSEIFFLNNTNSSLLLNDPATACTSYITFGTY